ncbi:MAG TPA: hypothetical protein DCM51_02740 [Actinobacteria bacterium]|nr:hypothetical protein [Actinomycetota bacterium]
MMAEDPSASPAQDASSPESVDLPAWSLARARANSPQPPKRRSWSRWRRNTSSMDLAMSGPSPDDRDPQPLSELLRGVTTQQAWSERLSIGSIAAQWTAIAGPDLAAHCQPESFDNGELVISADSTAWATQVRLLVSVLQARLDDELGAGSVRSVVVRGPAGPRWRRGPRSVPGRGPRDTYG